MALLGWHLVFLSPSCVELLVGRKDKRGLHNLNGVFLGEDGPTVMILWTRE